MVSLRSLKRSLSSSSSERRAQRRTARRLMRAADAVRPAARVWDIRALRKSAGKDEDAGRELTTARATLSAAARAPSAAELDHRVREQAVGKAFQQLELHQAVAPQGRDGTLPVVGPG